MAICLHLPPSGLAATRPRPPPLCLARPSLLTALTLQVLNSVGKGQVTQRWTGVSGTSRSCWEGWTGDLKHERWASVHTESRQTQASLLPETGSLAKLHATPGPLHRLVLPQRSFPALHTVSSSLSLAVISPVAQMAKNLPTVQETWVSSLGREDPLEKGMAAHSSNLVWRIPWTEEPGGLQSMGVQRVGHDRATNTSRAPHSEDWTITLNWSHICPPILLP